MKIRYGFVSNSSTSSFMIYGVYLDYSTEEIFKKLIATGVLDPKVIDSDEYADSDYETLYSTFSRFREKDLIAENPSDCGWYIGMSPKCIGEDETMKEFKERVSKTLKELLGEDLPTIGWHEEAWME